MSMEDRVTKARKMCHDINQPLTVIMARSELLTLKMSRDDEHYSAVRQIHEQTKKLSTLVEDLRNLIKTFPTP